MNISVRLKFWFFQHYWWLLCLALPTTVLTLVILKEPVPTVVTVVGSLLSMAYFLQKQKLEELKLFREIFRECNERYDRMNDALTAIATKSDASLSQAERVQVIDYLNLCGEEYLYFKRGYIEPIVWEAWHAGMRAWIGTRNIGQVWEEEKNTGSYYDLPL